MHPAQHRLHAGQAGVVKGTGPKGVLRDVGGLRGGLEDRNVD